MIARALTVAIVLVAATARADREAELREAIAHATTPAAHARALYELGLLQEAAGDRDGAKVSYVESLRDASDPVVRARLATIDRELAESFDPFAPEQLRGPFASLEKFGADDEAAGHHCATIEIVRELPRRRLRAPIRRAVLFDHGCDAEVLLVGVELADGWYLGELAGSAVPDDKSHCGQMPMPSAIGIVAIPGETARLRVDYQIETTCSSDGKLAVWGTTETDHVVVGIGPSGFPSVTAPITSASGNWRATYLKTGGMSKPKRGPIRTVAIAWHGNGSFTIGTRALDDKLVGRHAPRFP